MAPREEGPFFAKSDSTTTRRPLDVFGSRSFQAGSVSASSRPVRDLFEQLDTVLEGLSERVPDPRRRAPGPRLPAAASPRHQGFTKFETRRERMSHVMGWGALPSTPFCVPEPEHKLEHLPRSARARCGAELGWFRGRAGRSNVAPPGGEPARKPSGLARRRFKAHLTLPPKTPTSRRMACVSGTDGVGGSSPRCSSQCNSLAVIAGAPERPVQRK